MMAMGAGVLAPTADVASAKTAAEILASVGVSNQEVASGKSGVRARAPEALRARAREAPLMGAALMGVGPVKAVAAMDPSLSMTTSTVASMSAGSTTRTST